MSGFFAKDTTYARNEPYHAPEVLGLFHCVWSGKDPDTGLAMALGFQSAGFGRPWQLTAYGEEQWGAGERYVVAPEESRLVLEPLDSSPEGQ